MSASESEIDASVPADNVQVDKADVRENFRKARDEITYVLRRTRLPQLMAFGQLAI